MSRFIVPSVQGPEGTYEHIISLFHRLALLDMQIFIVKCIICMEEYFKYM